MKKQSQDKTLQSGYAKNAPNSLNENDIAVIAAAETFIDFLSRTQVQYSEQSWVCTKCRQVEEFPCHKDYFNAIFNYGLFILIRLILLNIAPQMFYWC